MASVSTDGEVWTIGRLILWTTGFFREKELDSPRLDAEVLLAHVLSCRRIDLYAEFETEVGPADRAKYREIVRQRTKGKPVAYLVGKREFYSLDFEITESVLIPRPETEILVGEVIERLAADEPSTLLDIGVGSGAIAVSVAVLRPKAAITAVDVSPAAIEVAKRNAENHSVGDRITFVESSLFERLDPAMRFDVIASNPPYVTTGEMHNLPVDVRDFEPKGALDGGADGLDIHRAILAQAPEHLQNGGGLVVEFGIEQAERLRAIVAEDARYDDVKIVDDWARMPRVLCARHRS